MGSFYPEERYEPQVKEEPQNVIGGFFCTFTMEHPMICP